MRRLAIIVLAFACDVPGTASDAPPPAAVEQDGAPETPKDRPDAAPPPANVETAKAPPVAASSSSTPTPTEAAPAAAAPVPEPVAPMLTTESMCARVTECGCNGHERCASAVSAFAADLPQSYWSCVADEHAKDCTSVCAEFEGEKDTCWTRAAPQMWSTRDGRASEVAASSASKALHERFCGKLEACGCAGVGCLDRWKTDGKNTHATKFMQCALDLGCEQMCGDLDDVSTPIGRCRDKATAPKVSAAGGGGGSGGGPGAPCNYGVVPSGCRMPYVCLRCPRPSGLGTRAKCVLGGC